jgi:hypothetical protein
VLAFISVNINERTSATLKIAVFWDIAAGSPYMNRRSSETSVHIRTTRRYIPEDGNFYNYRSENLKSCILPPPSSQSYVGHHWHLLAIRELQNLTFWVESLILFIFSLFNDVAFNSSDFPLTLHSRVVTIYTTCFNILKLWTLLTQYICVFRMVLTVRSDFFLQQH